MPVLAPRTSAKQFAKDVTEKVSGIVALNRPLDGATAERIAQLFVECVAFPSITPEADAALAGKNDAVFVPKPGMRIPIDFAINDRDDPSATGPRKGIMCYSPITNDDSWKAMFYWSNTWTASTASGVEKTDGIPLQYELSGNYPNPFNPSTKINYSLAKSGMVTLKVYDLVGRLVTTLVDGYQEAGKYVVTFNTADKTMNLSSGVYFYRLESGSFMSVDKMMLLK